MIENTYVAQSKIHGKGLFARAPIKNGEIIGWLEGKPSREDGSYVLWISAKRGFEVTCKLKYIIHSNEPNACYYDDLSVVALCDIEAGEEITHNYACVYW